MKKIVLFMALAITSLLLADCNEELFIYEPGNLVPKTVDQDPSLPSIQVNGTQLHAEAFGNPNHPLLIFLHGGPGGDYRSGLNVKQLSGNGYYVIFYDQRGSGLSKRHDPDIYSMQLFLDDLTAVIDHYRSSVNQKVFLFGHSWGGMVAAAYINAYPSRINGVIFAEPGGFNKQLLDEYAQKSRKLQLYAEATSDVFYAGQFVTGKENEHEILDYNSGLMAAYAFSKDNNEGVEGPFPFWRNGAAVLNAFVKIADRDGFDFTAHLRGYSIKTLFLYGENNQAYGLSFTQKEAGYFPKSEIVRIDDTGHEMIYFKWNQVYPAVLNYLNSL